jgi:hypothetical protein
LQASCFGEQSMRKGVKKCIKFLNAVQTMTRLGAIVQYLA